MASTFVELNDLDLIEEGVFMADANNALQKITHGLSDFVAKHGHDAKGAKAELTLKIKLVCKDPDSEIFAIESKIDQKVPGRPTAVTSAMAEISPESGRNTLFVRNTGSNADNPRQGRLPMGDEEHEEVDDAEAFETESDFSEE